MTSTKNASLRVGRLGYSDFGIQPMEGACRNDEIERTLWKLPLFEGGVDHGDERIAREIATGDRRECWTQFDPNHLVSAFRERSRQLPGADADLQHAAIGCNPAQGDKVVHERSGVGRPHAVVQVGCLIERSAERDAALRVIWSGHCSSGGRFR
jgi:hypothetical protein